MEQAWIVVDGMAVSEYLTAVNTQQNQVSCWIPASEGKVNSCYLVQPPRSQRAIEILCSLVRLWGAS